MYVRVDNAREGNWSRQSAPDVIEVGGDNSVHEFSAWSKGLTVVHELYDVAECYLFVTDAFLAYGDDYQDLLDRSTLDFLLSQDAVAGLINRPGRRHAELKCLGWTMDFLRQTPDYWSRLRQWARSDSETTPARLALIDQHRALVERVTEKMVL